MQAPSALLNSTAMCTNTIAKCHEANSGSCHKLGIGQTHMALPLRPPTGMNCQTDPLNDVIEHDVAIPEPT